MTATGGYARFQKVMADFATDYMAPAIEAKKRKEELARPTDGTFANVFYGFTEVSGAFDALLLSGVLIGLSPPRSKLIKSDEYLKYLINAYFQEVYILEQRLSAYARKVLRMYGRGSNEAAYAATINSLLSSISTTFGGITNTRGSHVHNRRFSDERLDLLSGLTLISQFKEEFAADVNFEFKMVQFKWKKTISDNNIATQQFLDHYFDGIFPLVTRSEKIFIPRTGRGKSTHEHRA